MSSIHPKTSGAALGGALGVVLVAVLHSISGVHLAPEADAAIPAFLAALGGYLSPSPRPNVIPVPMPTPAPAGAPAPPPPATGIETGHLAPEQPAGG